MQTHSVHRGHYSTQFVTPLCSHKRTKTKASTSTKHGKRVYGGTRNAWFGRQTRCVHRGRHSIQFVAPLVLLIDQKPKQLLAPNLVHECMVGNRRPSSNLDLMRPKEALQYPVCGLLSSLTRSKAKAPPCTKLRTRVYGGKRKTKFENGPDVFTEGAKAPNM